MEIKKWSWLVFPVLVGVTVVFSFQWLVAGPDQIWRKLWLTGREVQTAEAEAAKLKNKLDKLKRVDMAGQKEILAKLEAAVPRRGQVEILIGEITQAAAESGVAVENYTAGNDEIQLVLKVTLGTDAGGLVNWVRNMENRVPIVKVMSINYREGRAEAAVRQVWKETVISQAKAEDELPEADEKVKNILSKLEEFRKIGTGSGQMQDDGGTNPNPF